MATLDPRSRPRRETGKRKRAQSTDALGSSWSPFPSGAINPFSRSPGERLQLSVAGLSDTDKDPTREIKHFPHRGLDPGTAESAQESEPDDGGEDQQLDVEGGNTSTRPSLERNGERRAAAVDGGGHLDVLLRSIHQFLDQGDVAKAARAYGLILQLRPGSRPIDVRQHNLWAMGAEILMREGEETPSRRRRQQHQRQQQQGEAVHTASDESSPGYTGIRMPARWGSPANIKKVKAYFETLIQKHPYDHKFARSVSALDFQLALLGCEIYNVHAEHTAALALASSGHHLADDVEQPVEFISDDAHAPGAHDHQARLRAHTDRLRGQALAAMRDITARMDTLMQQLPYYKDNHFLRLRATASLYAADLLVPTSQTTSPQRYDAENRRQLERQAAIDALRRLVENGGELDRTAQAILDGQVERGEEPPSPSPLYSSLPIRGT
ncbi:hypothetical protein TOPH_08510 [Tolypocladium ophioglossoides CBS 100239]|uniref:Uncharacterized protein n=1 Tax=Tolypocladium ophioglossoides (strain CBS 100239) TaxID=1163406 RepID=A0A0L0MYJ6_TOLOC|nr:hypothetical protein TOPH_08510 [Tolypocladium ophioglossoides CBS 100239]